MKNGFEELEVWKKAHQLTLDVYKLTDSFPFKERNRLSDQLCRASSSVAANIVEGRGRKTIKEYIQFLYISRGSLEETKYHLLLSKDLGYISIDRYNCFMESCIEIGKMLNGLIKSLEKR